MTLSLLQISNSNGEIASSAAVVDQLLVSLGDVSQVVDLEAFALSKSHLGKYRFGSAFLKKLVDACSSLSTFFYGSVRYDDS